MQTTKFKPLFNLAAINKECIRTVAVASTAVKTENVKPWKEIPGPSSLPIIGQLHHFMPGGAFGNIEDPNTFAKLIEKYGPIVRLDSMLGKAPLLFLSDPESSAFVLRSENWMPVRPGFQSLEHYRKDYRRAKGIDFHATGLISDNGEVWKEFRSTVNPVMLQPKTIKMYAQVLDEVALDMVARMKANRDEKNMIVNNFDKEMNLWALESIGTVALGCRRHLPPTLHHYGGGHRGVRASEDQAANTVTATLYLLAKHPEKQTKLREEIMSNSEKRPYLRACIKESLRVMPVVSGNARKSSKEYNILGYEVPIGVDIVFTHRDMSLMEKHYPRASEYIPERWLAKKDDPLYYGNAHPFVYGPFGFGARSCIGRRIAELEMDTFVARLIENFQVDWFGPPPKTVQHALNYIKGPFNFVFTDIK